jgi:TOBE domain
LVVPAESGGVLATVKSTAFCGSYHTITIEFKAETILVNTGNKKFVMGDTVHIAVAAEDVWYV